MRQHLTVFCSALVLSAAGGVSARADSTAVPNPTKDAIAKVTAAIDSGESSSVDAGVRQIHTWMDSGWIQGEFWMNWAPALSKAKRYQDVADLALAGAMGKPDSDIMVGLLDARIKALVALGKIDEGLQCAKGLYNVCAIAKTADGVTQVGNMLGKAHPDDLEIVRRFRNEQAQASKAASLMAGNQHGASDGPADNKSSILKSVKVNTAPYQSALEHWATVTDYFGQRVNYGNVLLVADRTADAEKLFRELYQSASNQDELTMATEGLARAMRAADGNVARANTWLLSLQSGK